jgi:transposase
MAFEGSTKTFVFDTYVERFLAPKPIGGQIVVVDDLGAHKTERVRELIEERGCQLGFLLAYSPDLSPVEEVFTVFSKTMALLKKAAARTREALVEAMDQGLSALTVQEVRAGSLTAATESKTNSHEYRR